MQPLYHLYSKAVLKDASFRLYRLLLDIQNSVEHRAIVKATRQQLMMYLGVSENTLRSAIEELLKLGLITASGSGLWCVNKTEKFNHDEIRQRIEAAKTGSDFSEIDDPSSKFAEK